MVPENCPVRCDKSAAMGAEIQRVRRRVTDTTGDVCAGQTSVSQVESDAGRPSSR
jgi:hypothetical protein